MSYGTIASAGDPLMRGLVGWYRMLGNANDSSGRGNTGTLVNSPTAAADKYGNSSSAYSFASASLQYMSVAQNSGLQLYSPTRAYSVCMWVKGASQSNGYIYSEGFSGGGQALFGLFGNTTKAAVFIRTAPNAVVLNTTTATTVFDNSWHHIAFTDNAGTANLYVDGVKDPTSFNYTAISLGQQFDRSTIAAVVRASVVAYFNGSLSDVRLYNRAITADEVGTIYRAAQRI